MAYDIKGGNLRVLDTKAEPKAAVVAMARELLARAEAGDFIDLSWCAARVDGGVDTSFTPTDDQQRRLASVSRLLFRLHKMQDEDET